MHVIAVLTLFMALLTNPAWATATRVDPGHESSITVTCPEEFMEDMHSLNIQVQVWRVADLDDNVNYTLTKDFTSGVIVQGYELTNERLNALKNSTETAELANALYKKVLGKDIPHKSASSDTLEPEEKEDNTSPSEEKQLLEPEYTFTISGGTGTLELNKEAETEQNPTGYYLIIPEDICSNEYSYSFTPTLISVPYIGIVDPNTEGRTSTEEETETLPATDAPYEDWIYDVNVNLKPEREPRYGKIIIEKKLDGYNETLNGANFVFLITAQKDDITIFSKVESISFNKDNWRDSRRVIVEGIPAGAYVVVEEVYSGSCYESVGNRISEPYEILAIDKYSPLDITPKVFEFENRPNGNIEQGASVLNYYSYVEESGKFYPQKRNDSVKD